MLLWRACCHLAGPISYGVMLCGAQKPWLLFLLTSVLACSVPDGSPDTATAHGAEPTAARTDSTTPQRTAEQVSQYIRCIFQDSDGDLWFGTTTDGVVRYDGSSLTYFNATNGFGSDWVNKIAQDAQGDLWFATRDGVVRFDGNQFTRYTTKDGLPSDHCWSLLVDRDGYLWAGTYGGVARYDPIAALGSSGHRFTPFGIPAADLSKHPYEGDPQLVSAMLQDRAGDIWFATKGGAFRYDGSRLKRFAGPEGLCSDFVNTIHQQRDGRLLFGTRFGGLCALNGKALEPVLHAELHGDNVGMLHEDRSGTLWVGLSAVGLCSRSGAGLKCYNADDGEGIRVVFCMLDDDAGRLWMGTGAGLYRYEGERFVNVTKEDLM